MDVMSIVLGALSLVTAFTPFIWLQVVGGCVGIAGIVLARKAKKADYRKSLLLCFLAPVLSLISNALLLLMTQ